VAQERDEESVDVAVQHPWLRLFVIKRHGHVSSRLVRKEGRGVSSQYGREGGGGVLLSFPLDASAAAERLGQGETAQAAKRWRAGGAGRGENSRGGLEATVEGTVGRTVGRGGGAAAPGTSAVSSPERVSLTILYGCST
jgi:hypothetical protein